MGNANEIFLEGDTKNIENEIKEINSRHELLNKKHDTLSSKHESLSRTVQGIAATGGASTANNVTYNNDTSGLNAENAQDAIDELANKTSTISEVNDKANYAYTKAEAANRTAEANKQALTTATSDITMLKKKVEDIPATIPKVVSMTESAYDDLETKEADTYYMLMEE